MASYVAKKDKETKNFDRRFQDKLAVIEKLTKEREEQDKQLNTLKDKVAALELEIKTKRADFDASRKLLSDRVSNLDKQLQATLEDRRASMEKATALDRQVSLQSVEIASMRQKETENTVRLSH